VTGHQPYVVCTQGERSRALTSRARTARSAWNKWPEQGARVGYSAQPPTSPPADMCARATASRTWVSAVCARTHAQSGATSASGIKDRAKVCVVQEIPYECVPLTILKVAHICTILNYHSHLLKRGGTVDISVLVGSIEAPPPECVSFWKSKTCLCEYVHNVCINVHAYPARFHALHKGEL